MPLYCHQNFFQISVGGGGVGNGTHGLCTGLKEHFSYIMIMIMIRSFMIMIMFMLA